MKTEPSLPPIASLEMPASRPRARAAFTLIEMLVVIAIIAILAAILVPATRKAIETARETTARTEVKSIVTAIQQYYNDYGKLPVPSGDQATGIDKSPYEGNDSKNIIETLIAENDALNPRKRVYLEVEGGLTDGTMEDPWGNQYVIVMDTNYDNEIQYPPNGGAKFKTIAIAVSYGKDGEKGDPRLDDDIASHEEK